jgi:hypothetical protein
MKANLLIPCCTSAMLLALNLSTLCRAQSATDPLSRMTITHVKPEMLNEWIDLQKEMIPALKKGGVKTRTVFQTSIFGTSFEYVTVTPFASFAEFDNPSPLVRALDPAGAARLGGKVLKCIVSQNSFSSTRFTDLSNLVDNDAQPPIIVSARYRIAPGKMQDFENLVKSDVLPIYKKAKVRFTVNRRGNGTNASDVTMVTYYAKFADMDGGPFLTKQLGQEAANKLNARFTGIRTMVEVVTRKRVDELSF